MHLACPSDRYVCCWLVFRSDERDIERLCQRLSNGDLIHEHDDDDENHADEELRQTASTTKHRYINTIT